MKQDLGRHALITLGMHRSGTSALTGVLSHLGIQLGKRLYAPQAGVNEKGFFEHSDITDINEDILLAVGSCWDDILSLQPEWWRSEELCRQTQKLKRCIKRDFRKAELWALKDPRMCRLLPLWQPMLAELGIEARYLLMLRHPAEVVNSLARRDGFSRDKAMILWLEHNLEAERQTRDQHRVIATFDALLENPGDTLARIGRVLQMEFPIPLEQARPTIETFISPRLRHHSQTSIAASCELEALAFGLYEHLSSNDPEGASPSPIAIDNIGSEFERIRNDWPAVVIEHMATCQSRGGHAQLMLNRIIRAKSWPWGRPFRVIERLLGGDV